MTDKQGEINVSLGPRYLNSTLGPLRYLKDRPRFYSMNLSKCLKDCLIQNTKYCKEVVKIEQTLFKNEKMYRTVLYAILYQSLFFRSKKMSQGAFFSVKSLDNMF